MLLFTILSLVGCAGAAITSTPLQGIGLTDETFSSWRVIGSAIPLLDGTGIRLTEDVQSQLGIAVLPQPANLMGREWRADFTFRIHGTGISLAGDGLGLWYTANPSPSPVNNILGGDSRFKGMGILVDTYKNDEHSQFPHPFISLVLNDGAKSVTQTPVAGCTFGARHASTQGGHRRHFPLHVIVTLRIEYNSYTQTLSVKYLTSSTLDGALNPALDAEWSDCFSYSEVTTELESGWFWSVTASTGDLTDNHDIYGLKLYGEEGYAKEDSAASRFFTVTTVRSLTSQGRTVSELLRNPDTLASKHNHIHNLGFFINSNAKKAPLQLPRRSSAVEGANADADDADADPKYAALESKVLTLTAEIQENTNQLYDRIENVNKHLEKLFTKLKATEEEQELRMQEIEMFLRERLEEMSESHVVSSRKWVMPVVVLSIIAIALAFYSVLTFWKVNEAIKRE